MLQIDFLSTLRQFLTLDCNEPCKTNDNFVFCFSCFSLFFILVKSLQFFKNVGNAEMMKWKKYVVSGEFNIERQFILQSVWVSSSYLMFLTIDFFYYLHLLDI